MSRRRLTGIALVLCALIAGALVGAGAGEQSESAVRAALQGEIAGGDSHTCALTADGGVRCWGEGGAGQRGDGDPGTDDTRPPATAVVLGQPARAIAAGAIHTCALLADGGVRCWGSNGSGELGNGEVLPGTGSLLPSAPVALGQPARAITAGVFHTCAILADGAVRCWGLDGDGQLGDGDAIPGTATSTPAAPVALGQPAVAVSAGQLHTCALLADGAVRCWGGDPNGQLGDGAPTAGTTSPAAPVALGQRAVAISAGERHTCAVLADGTVRCWGRDNAGQLGDGGPLPGNEANPDPATPVALGQPAVAVSAAEVHSCAILADGAVRCWGGDANGQLGDGDPVGSTSTPAAPVALDGPARAITSGAVHTCVVLATNGMRCWGNGDDGRLGAGGDDSDQPSPVPVAPLPQFASADSADLSLSAQASVATAQVGDAVTVTLTLANAGVDAATATVAAPLGARLTLTGASASQGSYSAATGIWTPGPLPAGASASLALTAQAAAAGASATTGEVLSSTARDPDSTAGNEAAGEDDHAVAAVTIAAPAAPAPPPAPPASPPPPATPPATPPVAKVAADALTLTLTPARDRTAPFAFTASGRLVITRAIPRLACAGTVTVTARNGRRAAQARTARLRLRAGDCTYSVRLTFRRAPAGATRLSVSARFAGNARLTARSSRPLVARLG